MRGLGRLSGAAAVCVILPHEKCRDWLFSLSRNLCLNSLPLLLLPRRRGIARRRQTPDGMGLFCCTKRRPSIRPLVHSIFGVVVVVKERIYSFAQRGRDERREETLALSANSASVRLLLWLRSVSRSFILFRVVTATVPSDGKGFNTGKGITLGSGPLFGVIDPEPRVIPFLVFNLSQSLCINHSERKKGQSRHSLMSTLWSPVPPHRLTRFLRGGKISQRRRVLFTIRYECLRVVPQTHQVLCSRWKNGGCIGSA